MVSVSYLYKFIPQQLRVWYISFFFSLNPVSEYISVLFRFPSQDLATFCQDF